VQRLFFLILFTFSPTCYSFEFVKADTCLRIRLCVDPVLLLHNKAQFASTAKWSFWYFFRTFWSAFWSKEHSGHENADECSEWKRKKVSGAVLLLKSGRPSDSHLVSRHIRTLLWLPGQDIRSRCVSVVCDKCLCFPRLYCHLMSCTLQAAPTRLSHNSQRRVHPQNADPVQCVSCFHGGGGSLAWGCAANWEGDTYFCHMWSMLLCTGLSHFLTYNSIGDEGNSLYYCWSNCMLKNYQNRVVKLVSHECGISCFNSWAKLHQVHV
jgi:hypothetical protein